MSRRLVPAMANRARLARKLFAELLTYARSGDYSTKYIYVGHHKCGTQYIQAVLRDLCEAHRIRAVQCDWRREIGGWTLLLNKFLLIQDYSSAIVDLRSVPGRGFHVIRDPRDILISLYYSHRDTHVSKDPKTAEILRNRGLLSKLPFQAGLAHLIENSGYYRRVMHELSAWDFANPRFYETTFERLVANPIAEWLKISRFLELPASKDEVCAAAERNSFEVLKRRWSATYPANERNHYRKGQPGEWRECFTAETKALFKLHFGELVVKLGYERDSGW